MIKVKHVGPFILEDDEFRPPTMLLPNGAVLSDCLGCGADWLIENALPLHCPLCGTAAPDLPQSFVTAWEAMHATKEAGVDGPVAADVS